MFYINENSKKIMFALGIDIGGTSIKAALVDIIGSVITKKSIATTKQNFLSSLFALIESLLDEGNKQNKKLIGIGIGTPGFLDKEGYIKGTYNITALNNCPLLSIIKEKYKLPTYIDNDASNAARGEFLFGAGKAYSNIILLTIGTGIGGGIIINDKLFGGEDNRGGEIGHITVIPDGTVCTCGNYGCLEAYSSASAIVAYVCKAISRGVRTSIRNYKTRDINGSLIAELAQKGDMLCIAAIRRSAYYIGIVLSNLINTLNIPLIVIGGGIAEIGEPFLTKIRETTANNILATLRGTYKIVKATLGKEAGIIGSAAYVFIEEK